MLMLQIRLACLSLCLVLAAPAVAANFMFEASFAGRLLEGRPLFWTEAQMLLLGRDGQLHQVDPRQAENGRRTAAQFLGYSTSEMRAALNAEFGDGMTVTSTGHYLVVHRPGESDMWGQRFEQLFRSMCGYFRVRGFELHRPEFPLVAVIYNSESEYYQQTAKGGAMLLPNTLGHYDPETNRVLMYDRVSQNDSDWDITANTIVHEATHQTAFNTGLHSRTAVTPKWVVEGLATMFEASGVYNSQPSDTRRDRINRGRLDDYRYYNENRTESHVIVELVASDEGFRRAAMRSYANAWALTFYLSETRPREYEQYLQLTAARPPLAEYEPMDRVRDFQSVFGTDLAVLENNFHRWMDDLR